MAYRSHEGSNTRMNTIWQSVTWDVARAGGFIAYILLAMAVIVGLALSTQVQSPSRAILSQKQRWYLKDP